MKKMLIILFLLLSSFAQGHGAEEHTDFSEAISIINNKITCDQLTDDQLEMLGDYYMEQMHPGESHVQMDQMMGGEGSTSLRQAHINMGYRFYCGSTNFEGHPVFLPKTNTYLTIGFIAAIVLIAYLMLKKG